MKIQVEDFLYNELKKLSQIESKVSSQNIEYEIFNLLKTRKFRKHRASESLLKHIKEAIAYNVAKSEPINITFLQGCYKLWRLEEAPEADWAELFALIYYGFWVKSILAIYKPGVVFDFYVDDLIMEKISNYRRDEIDSYKKSFQKVIDFVMSYCPNNLYFKITTVSSRFFDENDFWNKLEISVEKWKKPENLRLDKKIIDMIELNYRPSPNEKLDGLWKEEIMRIHDSHSNLKERLMYREESGKILAMPHHFRGGDKRLFIGSTKDSIIKYWIGVGALRKNGIQFIPTVLSPSQLGKSNFSIQDVKIRGLDGKNFQKIRVL